MTETGLIRTVPVSFLADDFVNIYLGAESEEQRFDAKGAAIPIDVHRICARCFLADRARKPIHSALEVSLVSEVKWTWLARRLHRPIA